MSETELPGPVRSGTRRYPRRTVLRGAALASAYLALGPWRGVLAQAGARRDLIVVSNNGGGGAGGGPSVTLVDPARLEALVTLPLGGAFSFPATRWDPARDLIWSGFGESGAVVAYRLSTGERVARVETGSSQNYTELTPDGRTLLVAARYADRFLAVAADPGRADFGTVLATLDDEPGARPCDVTIASDGAFAYAPDRGNRSVVTLDPQGLALVSRARPSAGAGEVEPYMATTSPTGNVLFVENAASDGAGGSESIYDLTDPAHPALAARLSAADGLGRTPLTSEITPDGRYGLVICRDSSEISVVDTAALKVVASVALPPGSNPVTGAWGPDGHTLFVPLPGRDAVAAVVVPGFRVARLIGVGPRPVGALYLEAPVPERAALTLPLGAALVRGRTFPPGCPDPCCGEV